MVFIVIRLTDVRLILRVQLEADMARNGLRPVQDRRNLPQHIIIRKGQ
jgi:hypothetical protein